MNARELAAKWDTMEEWERAEYILRTIFYDNDHVRYEQIRQAGLEALETLVAKIKEGQ
jgi:hypothetical protein